MMPIAACDAVKGRKFQVDFEYVFNDRCKSASIEWDTKDPLEIPLYGDEIEIKIVGLKEL